HRRETPLVSPERQKVFFRVVKAGFSAKRKKMRSSLAGGLGISKPEAEIILKNSGISPDIRAQDLRVDDWLKLAESL
ncbi:MAG: ribosomal RNA small subunit methyltransferase A, partial [Candidatus Saccharimonadales bacterium]